MCLSIDIGRRQAARVGRSRWVTRYAKDLHGMFRPGIIIAQRNLPGILHLALAMAEPVAHHKLNPGCRQHVDRCCGLELLTRQQFKAHRAWVGGKDCRLRFGIGVLDGYIAAKARTSHTHGRVLQIVMSAIRSPRRQIACLHRFNGRLVDSRLVCRIVQVLLSQDVAQPQQDGQTQRGRYFIPSDCMIKCLCNLVIDAPEWRLAVARLDSFSGGNLFCGNLFGGKTLALYQSYYACCKCHQCQDYPWNTLC